MHINSLSSPFCNIFTNELLLLKNISAFFFFNYDLNNLDSLVWPFTLSIYVFGICSCHTHFLLLVPFTL